MDKLRWGLGIRMRPLLWMVLRVWLVSAKPSVKRRGFLQAEVETQRGTGELEGEITNTEINILALCRVWLPLKCGLKLVKTCER